MNKFATKFGSCMMDDSLALWSLVEGLDTTQDTNFVDSLPLPSTPTSIPLHSDHQPLGPCLAPPFQVSDVVSSPFSSMGVRDCLQLRGIHVFFALQI